MTDHDPGDENVRDYVRPWWVDCIFRTGEPWIGMHSSLIYIRPPAPGHDAGDEDDYHNYIPSVHRSIGLRLWAPRDDGP